MCYGGDLTDSLIRERVSVKQERSPARRSFAVLRLAVLLGKGLVERCSKLIGSNDRSKKSSAITGALQNVETPLFRG